MTREECKKILPVLIAFANGNKVECKDNNSSWYNTDRMYVDSWIEGKKYYRIVKSPFLTIIYDIYYTS